MWRHPTAYFTLHVICICVCLDSTENIFHSPSFFLCFWFLRLRIYSRTPRLKNTTATAQFRSRWTKIYWNFFIKFFYRFLHLSYTIACFQATRANCLGGIVANACLCVYRVYVNACTVFNIFRGNVYKRRVLSNTWGSDISSRYTLKYRFRCTFVYTITQAPNAEINLSRHN